MFELFAKYIIDLYQDVPIIAYEGLICLFFLGTVALIALKDFRTGWRLTVGLLALEYIVLIYCATVIFRAYTETVGHNPTLFWSYRAIGEGKNELLVENIMNVVAFVPVGLLLSCVSRKMKWRTVLLIGFGISLSIESLQFVLKRGFSEIDDVFHNMLGCLIGLVLYTIAKCGYERIHKRNIKSLVET